MKCQDKVCQTFAKGDMWNIYYTFYDKQISFIFLGNFKKFQEIQQNFPIVPQISQEKNRISFNFYNQTLADIAAHSVTQTLSWPVLENIVTISKNIFHFPDCFY